MRLHARRLGGGLVVLFAVAGAGCASVPLASTEQDTWAKTTRPPQGHGTLFLYRNEYFGAATMITIVMDGQAAGETAANTYFRWDLPAGEHVIEAYTDMTRDRSTLHVDVTAGTVTYVWQEMKMGAWAGRPELHLMDVATGRDGVGGCRLVHAFAAKPAPRPVAAAAPPPPPAAARPLFARLGGLAALTAVVDETTSRGARDERLARWFAGRDLASFKSAFVNQLCASSGGPCPPGAQTLAQLYAGLGLAAPQADAFLDVVADALRHFRIGEAEEREVMALLAPIKAPPAAAAATP